MDSEIKRAGSITGDAADRAETLLAAGDPEAALAIVADELATNGPTTNMLTVAASAWVTLVDRGAALNDWPPNKRGALLKALIIQEGSDASFPILHHRIAAHHTGGVIGHLSKEARALGPMLNDLLREPEPHPRAVLLALLLRDEVGVHDQNNLSVLHRRMFASFGVDDLRIPYSIVFERNRFRRNVEDLKRYVEERGQALIDGSLPLQHLLLLYWLTPQSFANLTADWAKRAICNRPIESMLMDEAAAARSLRLRFNIAGYPTDTADLALAAQELAGVRRTLLHESGSGDDNAISRLDQKPRQLAAAILNEVKSRAPIVRSRRRLRVAVCISGQLRGFRRAWTTWRPLLANVDATVFVDSWTKIGRGTPEPFRSTLPFEGPNFCAAYKRIGTDTGLDELRIRYPSLFAVLDQGGTANERDVSAFYKTSHVRLDDETNEDFANFTNSEKMYYKIERCFEMTQATSAEFDLIVRLRPDKPISAAAFEWQDLHAALRSRPALYCETKLGVHYGALLMGDQVAIGLPEAMRVYAETFSRSPAIAALSPYRMEPHLWAHTSLAQMCWFSGIEVRKAPIKFSEFLEAEPLSCNLINEALQIDCTDRIDDIDRQLLDASRRDLQR